MNFFSSNKNKKTYKKLNMKKRERNHIKKFLYREWRDDTQHMILISPLFHLKILSSHYKYFREKKICIKERKKRFAKSSNITKKKWRRREKRWDWIDEEIVSSSLASLLCISPHNPGRMVFLWYTPIMAFEYLKTWCSSSRDNKTNLVKRI